MGVGGQRHAPSALHHGKRPGIQLYGRLCGYQCWYGRVRKIWPPAGIRSLDCPACKESVFGVRYPGPLRLTSMSKTNRDLSPRLPSCLDSKSVSPVVFSYTDEHRPLRLSITNPGKNDNRTWNESMLVGLPYEIPIIRVIDEIIVIKLAWNRTSWWWIRYLMYGSFQVVFRSPTWGWKETKFLHMYRKEYNRTGCLLVELVIHRSKV